MTPLERLAKYFEHFPGIGPRQARRFVHHLLNINESDVAELSELIATIQKNTTQCASCFRFFSKNGLSAATTAQAGGGGDMCNICSDTTRDASLLMILERDADIVPIEHSGNYSGYYFILGGTVPLLDKESTHKVRGGALKRTVEKRIDAGLHEIILAFSVNPDGENTARYIETILKDLIEAHTLAISTLGRGLSTGSELEYADPDTIKNALRNRS